MEVGDKTKDFSYTIQFTKLTGNDSDDDDLYIAGVASDENKDLDDEYVDMNSLKKAWNKYLKTPIIRFQHDPSIGAIGKVVDSYTESDGTKHVTNFTGNKPYIVGKISKAPDLESIRIKIREGIYTGLSIGGRAKTILKGGKKTLFIKDLLEISVVDRSSNRNSFFNVLKHACEGPDCKLNKELHNQEVINMESEITEFIEKQFSQLKNTEDAKATEVAYVELQKKYEALVAEKTEVKVEDPETVEKLLKDQVKDLTAEIEKMKTTGISKGISDGEKVEKGATEPGTIAEQMVAKYYGGN